MNDNDSKIKPYGDIVVKIGEYTDENGKTKGRYKNIGTLFATPHGSRIALKLDALPIGGDGWLNVYRRDDAEHAFGTGNPRRQEERLPTEQEVDKPLDISDIPF